MAPTPQGAELRFSEWVYKTQDPRDERREYRGELPSRYCIGSNGVQWWWLAAYEYHSSPTTE